MKICEAEYLEDSMGIGSTLKKIRLNRNMTQKQVAADIVGQGTYSRIEQDRLKIDVELFAKILQNLNISSNEFFYIHNNYTATEQQTIMQEFRDLVIVTPKSLSVRLARLEKYLKEVPSSNLDNLYIAYQILSHYINGEECKKILAQANALWKKFQQLDNWYIDDLILLNSLLFLLPVEIAEEITITALKRIHNYKGFEKDLTYLEIYFQLDLCAIFIQHQQYQKAIQKLMSIEKMYKQKMSYQTLSGLYFNKAICHLWMNKPYEEELSKIKLLLEIYEDQSLLHSLQDNFEEILALNRSCQA